MKKKEKKTQAPALLKSILIILEIVKVILEIIKTIFLK